MQVLDELPQVLTDASNLMAGLSRVADEAEENLVFLQGLTRPLGENGGAIVGSVQQSLNRLDATLLELQHFSESLNQSEGTVGQLVNLSWGKLQRTCALLYI